MRKEQGKGNQFVGDYGKDYSTGQERIIIIQGYSVANTEKTNEIQDMIQRRKNELEKKLLEVENFIAGITDSKIRTLLTLRFLEGESWENVGNKTYWKMSGDAARKCVVRYLQKITKKKV